MNPPATIRVSTVPHGTAVPPGYSVSGRQVPAGTYHQAGAGTAHYTKPRITSDRIPSPASASRYKQYFDKYKHGIRTNNVGRTVESSFSNYAGDRRHPVDDVARNTEGIRDRRPLSQASGSDAAGNQLRNYGGTAGTNTRGSTSITIDPFEIGESVPLLSSGAGSSAISGSAVALGTGAVAASVGLGVATSAVVDRIKNKGAVLPGTDYVGPGNPINIDAPRSAVDVIAKEHDIGYQDFQNRAERGDISEQEFVEGIDFLDNVAIQQFAERFQTGGEWQAFLGRWGLWLKNRIERVTGPIYPKFTGKLWASGKIYHRFENPIGTT